MNPDNFQKAWQSQGPPARLTKDAELLLEEVQRKQKSFEAMIFWRDVREVGIALVMVPLWIFLGMRFSLPWAWYLTLPVLIWIALFMLAYRLRLKRKLHEPSESLRQNMENWLAQVDHQIWLLRNVFWWALLPASLAVLAWFGHVGWLGRADGWITAVVVGVMVFVVGVVFAAIYWLNQCAVRDMLIPRRKELEAMLRGLQEEGPGIASRD